MDGAAGGSADCSLVALEDVASSSREMGSITLNSCAGVSPTVLAVSGSQTLLSSSSGGKKAARLSAALFRVASAAFRVAAETFGRRGGAV